MEMKRNAVVALYLGEKSTMEIVRELKHLKIHKSFVCRTIKRWNETGSVKDRPKSGRPKSATTKKVVDKVRKRIQRNPRRSAKEMAREMSVSSGSMSSILKNDLELKPYKRQKVHDLTAKQKKLRLDRSRLLLRRAVRGDFPNIVFSDEKNFPLEQYLNKQNDRVWLKERSSENLDQRTVGRNQHPPQVMVWAAVTANGRSPITFIEPGVKVNATYYREKVLKAALMPWARKHFGLRPWTFQQDSAPAHKARVNQEWLKNNVPNFISHTEWPSKSPDANPLDYCLWSILETKVGAKKYHSMDAFKKAIVREWDKIPEDHVRRACEAFTTRLKEIVKAKGGHIERK